MYRNAAKAHPMPSLVKIARRIRHTPGLDSADAVWDRLRPLYHRLIGARGRGVPTLIGGSASVRLPPEFTGGDWDQYEPESIAATMEWAKSHPGGVVLDIGCSIGIFCVVALFASPTVEVIAFDGDLSSVAAALRLCRYAPGDRLRTVWALLGDRGTSNDTVEDAIRATANQLASPRAPHGDPGTTKYVCLTSPTAESIPRHSLDQLFPADIRPLLIKCDVEGAELLVLRGAHKLLARSVPDILLSVHPHALETEYGGSIIDLRNFLHAAGYEVRLLAVDHEEHWWCSRAVS
jgi:FkbM family methyltransferase